MADLIGGLHLVHTEPLRLSNDETGTNDVEFTVSAAGVLTVTPMSGEKVVFGYDVEVGDDLVIDDTLTVTGVSLFTGSAGFGTAALAAVRVLLAAGSASLAPIRLTSGTVLTTPVAGSVEFLTDDYFVTISTGTARKGIVLDNGSRLTSGLIPVATTNGRLSDGPAYSGGVLTGSITGSAATLTTPRAINGVNFDGSAAITVTAAAGTLTGATLAAGVVTSSLTTIGTLVAGAVPASLVTAGTFPAGTFAHAAGSSWIQGHTALFDTQPSVTPKTQVTGTDGLTSAGMAFIAFAASALGPRFAFAHSRGASIGTQTRLNTNDQLGSLDFSASDGTIFQQAAFIRVFAGATQSATSLPSYVEIGTTADTTTSTRSIVRFTAAGDLALRAASKLILSGLTGTTSYIYEVVSNVIAVNVSGNDTFVVRGTNAQLAGDLLFNNATYDIGKSGPLTAPRDGFFTRNLYAGGTLTIVGTTTLDTSLTGILRADAGVVSVAAGVGVRSIFDHFVDANNGTTVETDLYSDTLAAGRLATNGEKATAQYGIVLAGAVSSTQQVRVYFGGTLVFDTGALNIGAATTDYLSVRVTVIRVSSSVVRVFVDSISNIAALGADATYTEITGITLSSTQILKITGTAAGIGAASNQITAKLSYVQWLPAAA